MAVALQAGEVEVARLLQVHLAAFDHGVQVRAARCRRRGVRHQRLHRRMAAAGRRRPRRLRCATRPAWSRDAGVGDLVDHVVDLAAEGIEGGDRRAPRRRQEQEGVVEARAARRRPCPARTARASSRTLVVAACARGASPHRTARATASAARRPRRASAAASSVAKSRRSIFSRMRRPPCTTSRSSQPARPGDRVHQRGARQHQLARPGDTRRPARAPRRCPRRASSSIGVDAVARAVGERQVEAAARQVDAQVLPEVDELQRGADGVRRAQRRGVVDAVEVQQQAADRVGRAAAVVEQLGAVGVARACARPARRRRAGRRAALGSAMRAMRAAERLEDLAASARDGAGRADDRRAGRRGRRPGRRGARSAPRRLRRRCRRPCAQSGRSPRSAGRSAAGTARRRPESFRSDRRSRARLSMATRDPLGRCDGLATGSATAAEMDRRCG